MLCDPELARDPCVRTRSPRGTSASAASEPLRFPSAVGERPFGISPPRERTARAASGPLGCARPALTEDDFSSPGFLSLAMAKKKNVSNMRRQEE